MTAIAAAPGATVPRGSLVASHAERSHRVPVPAAGLPRDGDHHLLPARVPDLDVLHGLRPEEPEGGGARAELVGLDNYGRILDNNIVIPNFDFLRILVFNLWWALSNVVIHVVLGVAIALAPEHQGPEVQAVLPGDLHPAGGHPADHRRDGLAEPVRPDPRRGQPGDQRHDRRACSSSRRSTIDWLKRPTRSSARPAHPAAGLLRPARRRTCGSAGR